MIATSFGWLNAMAVARASWIGVPPRLALAMKVSNPGTGLPVLPSMDLEPPLFSSPSLSATPISMTLPFVPVSNTAGIGGWSPIVSMTSTRSLDWKTLMVFGGWTCARVSPPRASENNAPASAAENNEIRITTLHQISTISTN